MHFYKGFSNYLQINENGFCDGAGGQNMEHIYKQCTTIARSVFIPISNLISQTNSEDKSQTRNLYMVNKMA